MSCGRELGARSDEAQIIELIVTAGFYHVIAYVCNGAAVQHEEWAELPAARGGGGGREEDVGARGSVWVEGR